MSTAPAYRISARSRAVTRIVAAAALVIGLGTSGQAASEYPIEHPKHVKWSFAGIFGTYDTFQLQRGFQVYREVCAACHALSYVRFRNLAEEGGPHFTFDQVRALSAEYEVDGGVDEFGDEVLRPGRPSDAIPAPFPNKEAAQAANGGAYPVDLSLIAKARNIERGFPTFLFDAITTYQETGPDYLYSLLTGYEDPPAEEADHIQPGLYYNPYFVNGSSLAMPPPLSEGIVSYAQNLDSDASNDVPETVDQYSKDVTAFLMWAAEPHLQARKAMGFGVLIFLIVFAGLLYYTKKKVWKDVAH